MAVAIDHSHHRRILMRAMVWALIGIIYAPLLIALMALFAALDLGALSFMPAAALAAGADAMLYGARQIAIAASLIGVTIGSILLLLLGDAAQLWQLAAVGLLSGAAAGLVVRFPRLCTLHVLSKTLAGASSGLFCGALLTLGELLGLRLPPAAALAFLVSVNGVLYVATVHAWIQWFARFQQGSCGLRQSIVIGLVAMLTAASVWIVFRSIDGQGGDGLAATFMTLPAEIAPALLVAALAGAITGALLELFRVPWVHDV